MNELLTPEERAQEVKRLVSQLQSEGRTDLLLHAIGVPLLEELRIEAAKGRLSKGLSFHLGGLSEGGGAAACS